MRVAVTTPTGNVGQHVVRMLIRAGIARRCWLVIRVDSIRRLRIGWMPSRLIWVTVTRCWPPPPASTPCTGSTRPTPQTTPLPNMRGSAPSLPGRSPTNRISRVVFQSSIGAEKRHGAGEIDGLARTEELLEQTGANVLHLRCGFFFVNLFLQLDAVRSGVIPVVLPVDQPMAWVAPQDIAEVAVLRLLAGGWSGREVQAVHGPQDLSWRQATAIVAEATGHPLRAEQIPDEQMRDIFRGAGMGDGLVEAVMGMSTGLRDDFVPEQPGPRERRPRPPLLPGPTRCRVR